MLVLGVVHQNGQAHGYQVRRELLSWRADSWAKVAPGSIYQSLRTLVKRGLLEQVSTESGDGGPERTVYRTTPDGETEFFHLVRRAITDPATGHEALNSAFGFLHLLGRNEVAALFVDREAALRARLLGAELNVHWDNPPQLAGLGQLYTASLRTELDWAALMARNIHDGSYTFADDATNQA